MAGDGGTGLGELLSEAKEEVAAHGLTVLRQTVFGTPAEHDSAPEILREVFGDVGWPVTWLAEGDSLGEPLSGTHLDAVSGTEVHRLIHEGEVLGSLFSDGWADYCHVGGIVGSAPASRRPQQARDVLERIETAARLAGMDWRHVIRTWFYNDRILDWYGQFNQTRTAFFQERGVFDGLVPASTGIGGGNLRGAALVAEGLGVRPRQTAANLVHARAVRSPLQCPAMNYRSSFSRAVELGLPDHRRLYVSGTASIDRHGATARRGDVAGQIDLTLDVVEAILESRQADWADVTRAIAYVKAGRDAAVYRRIAGRRGLQALPVIITENDICRRDLLFELEVDAILAATTNR
ncbi:MAG: Rid family hydrolase [Planctomycetota bacterium]